MFARIFALCLVLTAVLETRGQTIRYVYDGGTPVDVASGQDITINFGTVNGTKLLRIYDLSFSTTPDDDVGKITISGSLGTGGWRGCRLGQPRVPHERCVHPRTRREFEKRSGYKFTAENEEGSGERR